MANITVSPEKTVIDPRFDIPEGLDDFVHPEDSEPVGISDFDRSDSDIVEVFTEAPSDDESDTGDISHDAPPVPVEFSILSQTIRMSPDGRQLVDVEVEVEDIPGVVKIDVRITK